MSLSPGLRHQLCYRLSTTVIPSSLRPKCHTVRWQSSSAAVPLQAGGVGSEKPVLKDVTVVPSPLTRASVFSLVRTIFLSAFLTRPILFKPGMWIMQKVANSESRLLNPDENRLLRAIIKPWVYDQFCAGTNKAEIQQTIQQIKDLGLAGVIISYSREIQLSGDNQMLGACKRQEEDVIRWRDGNLDSLEMVGRDNFLGIKLTGAGPDVTECLVRGDKPPAIFSEAIEAICERAKVQNTRLWIDSEQQAVQPTIDKWTIPLMRRYNQEGKALVYNTVQAYLKESRNKIKYQLQLADKEGWTLGIKLVRGAYIQNDIRELIHDTKADTDASYNGIVRDLLCGTFEGFSKSNFPAMKFFIAGHNPESVNKALKLTESLARTGELKIWPEFGQLQGMADDVSCEIVKAGESIEAESQRQFESGSSKSYTEPYVPRAYKYITWGTVQECMQYLVRRAVENSAAVDRMRNGAAEARKELLRRLGLRSSRQ